ncbi:MAG: outer membrane protein assembly factor BamC [Porticoccaceae bacterium]|jgi:outer membrane protein assembly factor BamC|nr:outer membrane protein assembly factor BamC [Porticoccaceae bacterium]MDG1311026.1 outer membrane protein assembly factor BamC [Porticoccaceae bacterium]
MKKINIGLIGVLVLNLAGCSWLGLRDRSNDYLLAEETAPTVIPGEMQGEQSNTSLGQIYPIPVIPTTSIEVEGFEVPRPQSASVNTFEQLVKIQSVDGRRWVLINISPSESWPRVRNLLNRNGIPSAVAEGSSGIIETVWVTFNSDEENSHRFRFSISPGVQIDSTEISALHHQVARGNEEQAVWPDSSNSDSREQDMLTIVANDLAAADNFASVSLLAQKIGGEAKVEVMTSEAADPYILVKLGFDRSWASVSYSAERGGYTTVDQNRSEGVMYVNYTEPSIVEDGFFSGWFGGGSDNGVLDTNYRVLIELVGANVEVRIVGSNGESLGQAESLRLLKILRSNMS